MDVSQNRGGPPKSSILIVFSIIFTMHFGGFPPIFGNTHIFLLKITNKLFTWSLLYKRISFVAKGYAWKGATIKVATCMTNVKGLGHLQNGCNGTQNYAPNKGD